MSGRVVDKWLPVVNGGTGEVRIVASCAVRKALSIKGRESMAVGSAVVGLGLGWDMLAGGREAIDLDTSVIAMSAFGEIVMDESVYFANLRAASGAMTHSGDEREGDADLGQGDDELVHIHLDRVPQTVDALFAIATVATEGRSFADVKSARLRVFDGASGEERCRFYPGTKGPHTALFLCRLTRVGRTGSAARDWTMQMIGDVDHTARDWGSLVPELRLYMRDRVPGLTSSEEHRVAVMRKGGRVRLADYVVPGAWPPPCLTVGLAWDVTNGVNIDLDASVIVLSAELKQLDIIFFGKLKSSDGAIVHGGDEREGDEKGDDERVHIDLAKVHPQAAYLCICINSYSGQELDDVKAAQCRLHLPNEQNLALFKLSNAAFLDGYVALCVGFLYRDATAGPHSWNFGIMAEAAQGRTAHDNVDEFQRYLARSPPSISIAPRALPAAPPSLAFTEVSAQQGGPVEMPLVMGIQLDE
jgi:tellurium resistance protein TerZ